MVTINQYIHVLSLISQPCACKKIRIIHKTRKEYLNQHLEFNISVIRKTTVMYLLQFRVILNNE